MKTKKVTETPYNFMQRTMYEYASYDVQLKQEMAHMDAEMNIIRQKYSEAITTAEKAKTLAFMAMEDFALENKDSLFSIKRSIATKFGNFGFRFAKPKLALLENYTWVDVLINIQKYLPKYVRVIVEVAKDKLLSDRSNSETSQFFPDLGITVTQDENFFIELAK